MVTIILWIIAAYLITVSSYLLFFAIISFFEKKRKLLTISGKENRFLILLPVYKEDEVILESAWKALNLNYNKTKFNVLVIADSLHGITKVKLKSMGCRVVVMDLKPRSKAKAINLALSQVPDNQYDVALVLDADNYLSQDALIQINSAFNSGADAIQCQRVAKEVTTPVSILDAISEGINNTIFRKGHRVVGLSAALSGSGMAFDYSLFKKVMSRIEATNGFDKDLEFEIISSGIKIEYLESVYVSDEKVASLEVLKNQRTRWFAAQLINIKKGFKFFKRNPSVDLFDKWFQMWIPSRLLLVGFMLFVSLLSFLFQNEILTTALIASTACTIIALILATPRKYATKNLKTILVNLPASFFTLLISLFSIQKAMKGFIHTPHSSPSQNKLL